MTWALQVMAILSIIVGLIILHTISREKARRQRRNQPAEDIGCFLFRP